MADSSARSTRSKKSGRPGSTRSGNEGVDPLTRVTSGNYLDDHSHYHAEHEHEDPEQGEAESTSDDADLSEKDEEIGEDLEEAMSEGIVSEVRAGIETHRDMDIEPARERRLSRIKSSKSARERDPNLVTWNGPEDPENPKNWTFRHKWAAVLVGR